MKIQILTFKLFIKVNMQCELKLFTDTFDDFSMSVICCDFPSKDWTDLYLPYNHISGPRGYLHSKYQQNLFGRFGGIRKPTSRSASDEPLQSLLAYSQSISLK